MIEQAVSPPEAPRSRMPLQPDRPRIAAAAVAGWLVGLLPYITLGHGRGWFELWAVAVAAVVAGIVAFTSVATKPTGATEEPKTGEWLLAAGSAAGEGVAASFAGLLFYGIGSGGASLWNILVAPLFDMRSVAPAAVGFWCSILLVGFIGAGLVSIAAEKLTRTLYPASAGSKSVYYPLLEQPLALAAIATGVSLSIAVALLFSGAWWATLLSAIIIVYVAMPLDRLAAEARPADLPLTDVARRVLEQAGYTVRTSPKTGDAKVDPLIRNVTLLVWAGDEAFAIEMVDRPAAQAVEWNVASAVRTASTVLRQRTIDGRTFASVRPLLVVSGGTVAASLTHFSRQEGVPVVHLPREDGNSQVSEQRLMELFKEGGLPIPARSVGGGTAVPA